MKRKKGKTRSLAKFTEEEMKEAVLRVAEEGEPLNRVSEELGLCQKTLKSYFDKYQSTAEEKRSEFTFRPNYEINQVFTHELEKLFEDFLVNMNRTNKLTRCSVRKLAFEFAMTCNVHVPKTWNIRQQAGLDWMYGYLNRHPVVKDAIYINKKMKAVTRAVKAEDLVEEAEEEIVDIGDIEISDEEGSNVNPFVDNIQPQFIDCGSQSVIGNGDTKSHFSNYLKVNSLVESAGCADDVNLKLISAGVSVKTPIDEFEENVQAAYFTVSRDGYVPSDRVFNMDEISLLVGNPSPQNKDASIVITACCFISASGHSLPPFMVFPRAKFKPAMLSGYEPNVCGYASPTGLINDVIFLHVLQHFRDLTHASVSNKVVLIVDDDEYHVTILTIDYCEKYGIELVTLPPQYAPKLHPIGRYAFKMLKSHFNNACSSFQAANPDTYVSMYDVSLLFNTIYPHAFTAENIIRGFNETGIYPLDEKIFVKFDDMMLKYDKEEDSIAFLEPKIELVLSGIQSTDVSDAEGDPSVDSGNIFEIYRENEPPHKKAAVQLDPNVKLLTGLSDGYNATQATNFDKNPQDEYFDNLVLAFNELNKYGGISPERVYNMDEMHLDVPHSEMGCLAYGSAPRIRVCCCVNAAGQTVPPFFVYPDDMCSAFEMESCIKGAKSLIFDKFPREEDIFVEMLKHFVRHVTPTPKHRVLLVIDDDHHHISINSMDFCFEHGIVLVCVPLHSSIPLQPLEKTVFKTLTSKFKADYNAHLLENGVNSIPMLETAVFFEEVYTEAFSFNDILKGFSDAGIWPLSQEKICDRLPSEL